jgi:CRISPR/Cas system endoribonuclease Cas6 (RAMP superfamily)
MRVGRFRFVIAPRTPLLVPALNKGNMLRGGFGHAFRRLCCIPQCKDARSCPVEMSCPYKAIFEPSPPPDAEALSKNQDIPRPFVFRAPQTQQTRFEPSEPFEFELVLIGSALDSLPYFVLSFRELVAEGLGLNRAKCDLQRVEQIDPWSDGTRAGNGKALVVYTSEDQLFRTTEAWNTAEWIETRMRKGDRDSVRHLGIRFVTPTLLKSDGEIVRRPEFHHVFKRLRDRINALSTFFGEGPIEADFRDLGKRAESIRTVSVQTEWIERFRTSSKTKQRHELSGFVGEVTYEGNLNEFLPWLTLGELVHVGKHTAWGNGWIEMRKTDHAS